MTPYTGYIVETLLTLGVVCALAFFILWGARRMGIGRPSGPLALCGHLPLDARRAIYLVKVGDRAFVVGVAEGGFTKLGEMPASELPPLPSGPSEPRRFAEILARVLPRAQRSEPPAKDGVAGDGVVP